MREMSAAEVEPANFSWFVDGRLAAMGYPHEKGNIRFLVVQGIKTLINLSAMLNLLLLTD